MNAEIISNYENGFVVSNSDEWYEALHEIYSKSSMRKTMGQNGRKLVEKHFTIQSKINDYESFFID